MQAGLFPTRRDPWPPIVTPQFPQNPVVASSRDPNMEMAVMTFGLGGLAAGSGYRGAVGRMVSVSRPMEGPLVRNLAAARVLMSSGKMHRMGMRGLGDPCTDHTATDWTNALATGAHVFSQIAAGTHDAGWQQAGTTADQIGTGARTIASGLCTPQTPAQTFVGSQNDMQNAIANARNQSTPQFGAQPGAGSMGYGGSAPKSALPWVIGGGVAVAAIIAAVLIFK
jgi:hypothetical protein